MHVCWSTQTGFPKNETAKEKTYINHTLLCTFSCKFPQRFILRSIGGTEAPVFEMNIEVPPSKKGKSYMKHSLNITVDTCNAPLELIPIPANDEEEQANPTMFFKLNYSLLNKGEMAN